MGWIRNFIFFGILLLVWAVAGGFITQATVFLQNYKNSPYTSTAYKYGVIVTCITWILIGITAIVICIGIGTGTIAAAGAAAEEAIATGSISYVAIFALVIAIILNMITGVLSVYMALNIAKSPKYSSSNHTLSTAYEYSIIGACMCLISVGILIIGMIIYLTTKHQQKMKYQAREKELTEKHNQLIQAKETQLVKAKQTRQQIAQAQQEAQLAELQHEAQVAQHETQAEQVAQHETQAEQVAEAAEMHQEIATSQAHMGG